MSSDAVIVALPWHCNLKRWPASTSFRNGPACWGLLLSSDAVLFVMGLLAGDCTCHLTLLLSFCAGTVVSRGGLLPPLFKMGLLVGDDPCHLMLLL